MPMVSRVALETLGCKLNQAEAESLGRELEASGLCIVDPDEPCDAYILIACTVTAMADAKARHLLRLAYRRNPQAVLAVAGCYGTSVASLLESLPNVRVLLCRDKTELVTQLRELSGGGDVQAYTGRRTRAFVKAQEGCSNFCTYCIVPFVRGGEKSLPSDVVISEISARVKEGRREVILTGTEIGAYRHCDLGLTGLLRRILNETTVDRVRLSSLQPTEVTTDLLDLWSNTRMCPHFHLSLQSGNDGVLQRMGRRYNTSEYRDAVVRLLALRPDVAVTTDVIVGFPGETEEEFEESFAFCASLDFARIHVFVFSPRFGTAAASMPDQVPVAIKKERGQRMRQLADESASAFRFRFLNQKLEVLWETENKGVVAGYTGNYMRVYAKSNDELINRIMALKLLKLHRDGVWGEIEKELT